MTTAQTPALSKKAQKKLANAKKLSAKPQAPKPQQLAEPKIEAPTPKVRKERETMTKHARIAIREGKTRDQVWELLKTEWKLPVEKKWYVNWYFAEAKRAGIDIGTSKLSAEPKAPEAATE